MEQAHCLLLLLVLHAERLGEPEPDEGADKQHSLADLDKGQHSSAAPQGSMEHTTKAAPPSSTSWRVRDAADQRVSNGMLLAHQPGTQQDQTLQALRLSVTFSEHGKHPLEAPSLATASSVIRPCQAEQALQACRHRAE